ncbi:hypothetical protein R3P38DRAFT_2775634 [Favolaschia claudopus]|uniref:Uncharacterized protein n=1 Tax=Favolaschia claudopus TaxID=2862362 RepID=A0AAW0BS34_9AGAR
MVETKKVPNSLQVSLVSPQTPEQVSLRCYIDLNGKRKAWTESHTEYTRQPQSTDVKVWDNYPARTLSFGKETADQAIQQGNARNVKEVAGDRVNGSTYSSVQGNGQPYIKKAAFREKVSESTGIHGVVGIVGGNLRRINSSYGNGELRS